ncbi:MAG TPA: 6-carboxytetrahydropterin synthase QueD [Ktedonobacterales bacterium]|nr:6-carboxytetrahydropterin synthase QueD [Ktedonobacterales bacterium]
MPTTPYATIAKEFTFDAAHSLPNSDGPCRRLHGHTYRVRVVARGPIQPVDGGAEEGMVVDFARIKEVFKRRIETRCDHQFLNETVPVPRTTAELLAVWMLGELRAELPQVIAVRLSETSTSFAEVTAADLTDRDAAQAGSPEGYAG